MRVEIEAGELGVRVGGSADGDVFFPAFDPETAVYAARDALLEAARRLGFALDPTAETRLVVRAQPGRDWLAAERPADCNHAYLVECRQEGDGPLWWSCPCGVRFLPLND